ncbi:MAG: class I SAM-dependent methyltransferase [Acidimicrobiales bacterium]
MGLRTRFDEQAAGFDSRAGLGADIAREVAAAVFDFPHEAVLELGPGTGELGRHLAAAARRYVGIDSSLPMLVEFARRQPPPRAVLVQADAGTTWPVRSGSVDLVFAARAAHLLEPDHLCAELLGVCRPGGTFLVGRVERQPDGLRNRLRQRRWALLAEHGVRTGDGRGRDRRLFEALAGLDGAVAIRRRAAATWPIETSADAVIAGWAGTGVAGGRPVPPEAAAAVLDRLRAEFAGQSEPETETYTLEGIRLP